MEARISSPPGPFTVCVHRGTQQIGGTCIELACDGQRILLDLGLPLDSGDKDPTEFIPEVHGLRVQDPRLLAVVLSHGHADHWGLLPHISTTVPVVAGAATRRILDAAAAFVPGTVLLANRGETGLDLADRKTLRIGPFSITPFLVDHSAYDAYALLIEAGRRRLFYSGDLRGHGRKGALFERMLAHPPRPVHAMLMEGSSLGRLDPNQRFPTETELEAALTERFRTPGFIGVCASAQNIDRIVTLYRACKRTGRTLVLDLYAMEILRATENPRVPGPGWPNLAIYVPEYQRRHIKRTERFEIVERYRRHRIFREGLAGIMGRVVMLFRPPMASDIDLVPRAWTGARMIWSLWDGYLDKPANALFHTKLSERAVPFEVIHTSGHASIADLKRLADAVDPDVLVPVHTFHGDRFANLFARKVHRYRDEEWWSV